MLHVHIVKIELTPPEGPVCWCNQDCDSETHFRPVEIMVHETDLCMGINESTLIVFLMVTLPSAKRGLLGAGCAKVRLHFSRQAESQTLQG